MEPGAVGRPPGRDRCFPEHEARAPTAYCRKVKKNQCVISWGQISVSADPNYIIDLWVFLEDELVFHASGFFQTSMTVGHDFLGEGIPVKCGRSGSTPLPDPPPDFDLSYGSRYDYTIRASDSAGLKSANYGSVVCPPK
jgi:hypothetical protein